MTENEVTIDGVRYVAVGMPLGHGCKGCAGDYQQDLCNKIHDQGAICGSNFREDGREVIWQVAPSTPDELTAIRELNRELVEALEVASDRLERMGLSTESHRALIAKARGEK